MKREKDDGIQSVRSQANFRLNVVIKWQFFGRQIHDYFSPQITYFWSCGFPDHAWGPRWYQLRFSQWYRLENPSRAMDCKATHFTCCLGRDALRAFEGPLARSKGVAKHRTWTMRERERERERERNHQFPWQFITLDPLFQTFKRNSLCYDALDYL